LGDGSLRTAGTLEKAAVMPNHALRHTTQPYNRRRDELSLDEVARIATETAASFRRRAALPSAKVAQPIIGRVMIEVGRRHDAGTHRPLRHSGHQRFARRKRRVGTVPNEASLSLHEPLPVSAKRVRFQHNLL